MVKKLKLLLATLLITSALCADVVISKSLIIEPQIKIGKIENGNRFGEIQYAKFEYFFVKGLSLEGALSTGFTAGREQGFNNLNHAVNRIGLKATYRPTKDIGFFVEGSWSDVIKGENNRVDYLVYENYQAVGVSLRIAEYN